MQDFQRIQATVAEYMLSYIYNGAIFPMKLTNTQSRRIMILADQVLFKT